MIIAYWLLIEQVFPTYFVPLNIGLVFEVLFAATVLCLRLKRRSLPYIRIPIGIIAYFGVGIGVGFLRSLNPDAIWMKIICQSIIYAFAFGLLFFFFSEEKLPLVLVFISMVAIRESADSVDAFIKNIINYPSLSLDYIPNAHFAVNGLLFDIIHLLVCIPLGLIFYPRRKIKAEKRFLVHSVSISFGMLVTTIVIKSIVTSHSGESAALYICVTALAFFLSILTLMIGNEFIFGSSKSRDLQIAEEVLATQQRQFESSKQSIYLINEKIHDIKHRLDDLGDQVAESTLAELKESISIYDRPFHTGSQVLDTVLYTKSLICEASSIRLTAIGNATSIHSIPSSERFYFFSNILDNAIEATKDIPDVSKRLIGLVLEERKGAFYVESYNYFVGTRKIEDSSIKTSKKDKAGHGYGLQSIRDFARRHGGESSIRIEGDMFFITVSIPLSGIAPSPKGSHSIIT